MAYNLDLRKTLMEVPHIVGHRLQLRRGARVLGVLHILGAATGIHHMTAHTVVTLGTIGHFPRIDLRIFVVIDKTFHLAVQVYQVGIAYLLPATPTLAYRVGVPVAYLLRGYLTAFRGGCAVR